MAIDQNDLRVILLDTKARNPNHYICLALARALAESPRISSLVHAESHNALRLAADNACNLFIAFDGEELDTTLCARLSAYCGRSVLWVTEDPYEITKNKHNAAIFDLVFSNDSGSVAHYGKKGRHLPLAASADFQYLPVQESPSTFRYDLFFAGTAWPNRVTLIRDLLTASDMGNSALRFKLALPGNEHLPAVDLPRPPSFYNWRMSMPDFSRFANISLATLVLPRVFSGSGDKAFAETPPPRLFETALSGSLQLVSSTLEQAKDYFKPGTEFLYFDNAAHLLDQVRHLKLNPDLRFDIATNAQKRALEEHLYKHRVDTILDAIQILPTATAEPIHLIPFRPRLLFVTHNLVRNGNFGGVEVYLLNIVDDLSASFEVFFFTPAADPASGSLLLDRSGKVLETFSYTNRWSPHLLTCAERENAFGNLISDHNINFVHFHHLINHVPSLVEIAYQRGARTAFTFHDFYTICDRFTLIDHKGKYCSPTEISKAQCDICLQVTAGIPKGAQSSRRAFFDRILAFIDYPIFNTKASQRIVSEIYPSIKRNLRQQILPVPSAGIPAPMQRQKLGKGETLNVAVLGNFTRFKGADEIISAAQYFSEENIVFYIFGRIDAEYQHSNLARSSNVKVLGSYSPNQFPSEINECHVSLHLSIWPETYCLTLSEAWHFGLVPIVSDIGALGERVQEGISGYKIPPGTPGALIELLLKILDRPALINDLSIDTAGLPISRQCHHIEMLGRLYRSAHNIRGEIKPRNDAVPCNISYFERPWNSAAWGMPATAPVLASSPPPLNSRIPAIRILLNYYRAHGLTPTLRRLIGYLIAKNR